MEKKFYVVFGSEENYYEPEVFTSQTKEDAKELLVELKEETYDEGYNSWGNIAEGEEEKNKVLNDLKQYRKEQIAENFGVDEDGNEVE